MLSGIMNLFLFVNSSIVSSVVKRNSLIVALIIAWKSSKYLSITEKEHERKRLSSINVACARWASMRLIRSLTHEREGGFMSMLSSAMANLSHLSNRRNSTPFWILAIFSFAASSVTVTVSKALLIYALSRISL